MKLQHYETMYLLGSDVNDVDRNALSAKLQKLITDASGSVVEVNPWPLQKLAYRVKKNNQGYYTVIEFGAPGAVLANITRELRLDDRVLKFVSLKKADKFDFEAIMKSKQAKKPETGAGEAKEAESNE